MVIICFIYTNITLFQEPTPIIPVIIHKLDMEMCNSLLVMARSFRPIREKRDNVRLKQNRDTKSRKDKLATNLQIEK